MVTVYPVVDIGLTVIPDVFCPLLHEYDEKLPEVVKLTVEPAHVVGFAGAMVVEGRGFTVTVATVEAEQPLAVPVTV